MGASICLCQGPSRAVLNLHLVRRSGVEMQTLPVNNENPVKSDKRGSSRCVFQA